jgi:glyceraldehyde-3-phosphate dehydrogenase type I
MKVAIHGLGRIGRAIVRQYLSYPSELEIVALSDQVRLDQVVHLLKYDSAHGRLTSSISCEQRDGGDLIRCGETVLRYRQQADIHRLDWESLDVDLVLDCTGNVRSRLDAEAHLSSGARRVLLSHPLAEGCDATVVFGFNHQILEGTERVISNASCTSNALVPVLDCLHTAFGIVSGSSNTVHAAMNDQPVSDTYRSDPRCSRAAGSSVIPVDTGLDKGIIRFFPHLQGRFVSTAVRVPTLNVSALDVVLRLEKQATKADLHHLFDEALPERYQGIVAFSSEPLVSTDFNGETASVVVDASQMRVFDGGRMLKLWLWFDNEWAFAGRMLDVARHLARMA